MIHVGLLQWTDILTAPCWLPAVKSKTLATWAKPKPDYALKIDFTSEIYF